ncbi:uncharacterized protein LOC107655527 isoform X1 [Sinocyclocheilus anshuiensis]|uniref:Uncharacterized LOC107655527 n=2 Tax=Sinocyclocheilus anshuiensis TaxID=1608454 RepID=A0A671PHV9_9TELE|nr:PREDICTED: uncharacterized protein LOC107655527 isoform X1 [Sinocyclocheilus anshuiensis]
MASECTCSAQYDADDTFRTSKLSADEQRERAGYVNGGCASVASSTFFEVIGGSLYRRKLEKGFVQYREVLAEDKRLQSVATFHEKGPGKSHQTLDDTYKLVAEHYWWEGMYFQVRDYVFGCEECQRSQSERSVCSDFGLISRIVQSHSHQVLSKLNSQREAGLFCDITLKTGGGQSFVAHKAVLAAVSEYFQELFIEMDSAADPQSHVDLTGFSEQSLLALLEFSYTSTLNLNLDILTEVCAMAHHLRMWPALEACSAIKRERETCQLRSRMHSSLGEPNNSMPGPFRKDHSSTSGGKVGLRRRREDEEGEGSGSSWNIQAQHREHIVDKVTEEPETETSNPHLQCQVPSSYQVEENGFPCSPNRRMKLMDFKSPSCKKKSSYRPTSSIISTSPCTSTRYSSPSRRLLRSSPGAALALRRLLPKIDLSTKRKRKSSSYRSYKPQCEFSVTPSQSQATSLTRGTSVKVKKEDVEEEVCNTVPQDEVHSPRAQEKYRLLSFLGLQRKSLVPGPEELSGWGQKKRLRKLKVSNYSLTARRKPRAQDVPLRFGTSLGVLAAINPTLSLCDMSRMDLLNRPVKVEPWNQERSKRKRHDPAGQTVQPIARATRSRSLLQTDSSANDRPLRRHHRNQDKAPSQRARRGRVPAHNASSPSKSTMLRIKHESSDSAILQPIHRRNTAYNPQGTSPKAPGRRGRPPADRTVRVATTKLQHTKRHKPGRPPLDKPKSSKQIESKTKCNHATGMPQANHSRTERGTRVKENRKIKERGNRKDSPEVRYAIVNWDTSNHQQLHSHPLYKTIKEEPAEPLPLTQPFRPSDSLDLGKRQSKPPVKLLDQGFLFGFCRPPSGIKREEESVDIYLTQSVSHGSSSNCDSSPGMVRRDRVRARILPDRTGLNGPHWAGLGNRHSPFSQRTAIRVKTERDETGVSQVSKVSRVSRHPQVSKRSCKIKKEPTKTKNVNKLLPLSSRHSVLLETIRRTRLKQQKGPRGQASSGAHACLQCRGSYRDCDALIMHRIRHIEGKHWPCPVCIMSPEVLEVLHSQQCACLLNKAYCQGAHKWYAGAHERLK